MTVRELILALEKHDPDTPLVLLAPDYGSGTYRDLEGIKEEYGIRRENSPEWDVYYRQEEFYVKVLTLEF